MKQLMRVTAVALKGLCVEGEAAGQLRFLLRGHAVALRTEHALVEDSGEGVEEIVLADNHVDAMCLEQV